MSHIEVFTDGSTIDNGSKFAYGGIGIHFPNKEIDDISEPFLIKPVTNQRSELYAIYKAISEISDNLEFNKMTIYSDSNYSIKSLTKWITNWKTNNWKTSNRKEVKNQDIIKMIDKLLIKHKNKIHFIHVRAHTGKTDYRSLGNEKADELASYGSKLAYKTTNKLLAENILDKHTKITKVTEKLAPISTPSTPLTPTMNKTMNVLIDATTKLSEDTQIVVVRNTQNKKKKRKKRIRIIF
jgi:ribonuclease HI